MGAQYSDVLRLCLREEPRQRIKLKIPKKKLRLAVEAAAEVRFVLLF